MDILIGKQGTQPFPLTESSISRKHALFHHDPQTGVMTLKDNNSTNGTWILCKDGSFKRLNGTVAVGMETVVRLGAKQTFRIKDLLKTEERKPEPPTAIDISELRHVYEAYSQNKMRLDAKTSNIMMWRMTSMSLGTVFSLVISVLLPKDFVGDATISTIIKVVGSVFAIGLSWWIVDMKSRKLIHSKDQNERYFRKTYCCPKCGYHFGNKLFDNILAEGRCPNNSCKCKFTGK